jgi:hypothetical protein
VVNSRNGHSRIGHSRIGHSRIGRSSLGRSRIGRSSLGRSRIGNSRYGPFLLWSILGVVGSRNGRVRNGHSWIGTSTGTQLLLLDKSNMLSSNVVV